MKIKDIPNINLHTNISRGVKENHRTMVNSFLDSKGIKKNENLFDGSLITEDINSYVKSKQEIYLDDEKRVWY